MRIAVFIKSTTFNKSFGGLETQNKLLCEGLADGGHGVVVIAPAPDISLRYSELGLESAPQNPKSKIQSSNVKEGGNTKYQILNTKYLKYVFLDVPSGKYSKQWFRESLKVFQKLHKESPFDVIISQSMAGQAVVGEGVPVVVIQHGTILGELKTRWRALFVSACHSEGAGATEESQHLFKEILRCAQNDRKLRQFLFFLFRLVPYCIKIYIQDQFRLRRADKVIAVSGQARSALIREYFLPVKKITVVYNGIDIEKYQIPDTKYEIRKGLGIDKNGKVVLYVGRIEKEKGLANLLETVSLVPHLFSFPNRHPEFISGSDGMLNQVQHDGGCKNQRNGVPAIFLIVGNGPYLADLEDLAKQLGVADRVRFVGRVSYEDVPKYCAAADVFVLPSLREEGLPMTLLEAMASGLPIVASRIGGTPAAVKDGETGLLVEPGNIEKLAEAITKVLDDDELRSKMGRRARRLAEEKFSQDAMVGRTLRVVHDV